jgi:hypothetical protein
MFFPNAEYIGQIHEETADIRDILEQIRDFLCKRIRCFSKS